MKRVFLSITLALTLVVPCSASVVQTTNTVVGDYITAYPVSSTDLINAGQLTLLGSSHTGYTPVFGGALGTSTTNALNDGTAGVITPAGAAGSVGEVAADLDGIWTSTFQLNTNLYPKGYVITNITTIAAWVPSRATQKYEVLYSTVAAPVTFISLGTFTFITEVDGSSQMQLTDTTGILATQVSALQFNVLDPGVDFNHPSAFKEWDVFGYEIPEPGSAVLVTMGLLALVRRRCA